MGGVDFAAGLMSRQLPFLQIHLAIVVEVVAFEQGCLILLPLSQFFCSIGVGVQRAVSAAHRDEFAQRIDAFLR